MNRKKYRDPKAFPLGKKGFTLLELCIVMLLLAIIAVMVVSFAGLIKTYSTDAGSDYRFIDECANVKAEVTSWVRQRSAETTFSVDGDGNLWADGEPFSSGFSGSIQFEAEGKLIKCTLFHVGKRGLEKFSFVVFPRCGSWRTETEASYEK